MSECAICSGELERLAPSDAERISEGHIAVRFGDRYFVILIDDREVSKYAFEAVGGEDGWVARYPDPVKTCPTSSSRDHGFAVVEHGNVQIIQTLRTEVA